MFGAPRLTNCSALYENNTMNTRTDAKPRKPAPPFEVRKALLTIKGQLVSMKNRRRILKNSRTGKPLSAKSDEAVKYMADFILQVPPEYRSLKLGAVDKPLRATITVWYTTMRPDLDTALVWDCLQAAGVIANDRYIRERHEYREVDAMNPRVEIYLEEIGDFEGLPF